MWLATVFPLRPERYMSAMVRKTSTGRRKMSKRGRSGHLESGLWRPAARRHSLGRRLWVQGSGALRFLSEKQSKYDSFADGLGECILARSTRRVAGASGRLGALIASRGEVRPLFEPASSATTSTNYPHRFRTSRPRRIATSSPRSGCRGRRCRRGIWSNSYSAGRLRTCDPEEYTRRTAYGEGRDARTRGRPSTWIS